MKALFLHFYDFAPHSGISKKILYQIEALQRCGVQTELCYTDIDDKGVQRRVCEGQVIEDFGNGIYAKFAKWLRFSKLTQYILRNSFDFIYIRSFYNTNPSLLSMLKRLHDAGIKIALEFPTYPYDREISGAPFKYRPIFFLNKIFRNRLSRYVDKAVTFTDLPFIHKIECINISNGIDFEKIKLIDHKSHTDKLVLTGVAEIHHWHGFDRLIRGLHTYYKNGGKEDILFNIIGDGEPKDVNALMNLSRELGLEERVIFHGYKHGEELDNLLSLTDVGIASLARHRSGITKIKTLKNREYAARGIPFIYSEIDDDFENMPYIIKAPADETPIDINKIVEFKKGLSITPAQIRATIEESLSWERQMQIVIDKLFEKS